MLQAYLGGRRLRLTETERRRLAARADPLGRTRLQDVAPRATPDTRRRWSHRRRAQQFAGSTRRTQRGRPPVAEEVERRVGRMAEEKPTWGSRRLQGALAKLGHPSAKRTVRNRRRRHAGRSWAQLLTLPWEVLAATDCVTVAVAPWPGLGTYSVRVVMELATRRGPIAGLTPQPTAALMPQCARQLTEPLEGFLLGTRSLLHDRDTPCTQACAALLQDSGGEPVV